MAIINAVNEVLHRIRVKLYPNYLPHVPGAYIARTDDEASLSVEDVCAAAKNRGGYTGSYEDLVEHVKIFFDESAYQLADGFSVHNAYYSIHPKISGTFDKPSDPHDPKKHKINFSFRVRKGLRELADKIEVVIEGLANVQGYIDEILDVHSGSVNDSLTPGKTLTITGHKIKIAGDNPDVGLYFIPQGPTAQSIKNTENLAENAANKIIATLPDAMPSNVPWRVQIITQYASGGTQFLKEPRTIEFPVNLHVS